MKHFSSKKGSINLKKYKEGEMKNKEGEMKLNSTGFPGVKFHHCGKLTKTQVKPGDSFKLSFLAFERN